MSRSHAYVEPAAIEHLDRITPIEKVKKQVEEIREKMKVSKNLSYFSIFSCDGVLLGITGADVIEESCWEFWSIPDVKAADHFVGYSRAARDFLNLACAQHGIKRAQAWVDTRFQWADAWARFLGMEPEGEPVQLGDDGYFYRMFAKVSF